MIKNVRQSIIADAEQLTAGIEVPQQKDAKQVEKKEVEFDDIIKYIPTPNFSDCNPIGTNLPINMANEAVTSLLKIRSELGADMDFIDFVRKELGYNSRVAVCMAFASEQIDALVLAIKQFEAKKALILGDMAGIGKGRVCAGMLRYAYQKKKVPVFITEKPNLFSDMYHEIDNIGGLANTAQGANVLANPLIINAKEEKTCIYDDNEQVIIEPLPDGAMKGVLEYGKFPLKSVNKDYKFNCIFLTYSQLQGGGANAKAKFNYLLGLAKESYIIFDECHNASGSRSSVGIRCRELVEQSLAILFSSATYAKNPSAFPLYVIKSSMKEAQIDLEKIEKAIDVGGENVAEYISSVLVKEGQMIRRESSYEGCAVDTIYDGNKDEVYRIYNESMSIFKNVSRYIRSTTFAAAVLRAVYARAEELNIELGNYEEFKNARSNATKEEFIANNYGKYIPVFIEYNPLGSATKVNYKENLLNSIKVKLTTECVLKELKMKNENGALKEYTYIDGSKHNVNRKPIIALRQTGETIFKKLNLNIGDTINNEFAEYLRAIMGSVYSGTVKYYKVNEDLYTPRRELPASKRRIDVIDEYTIKEEYFDDNGALLKSYIDEARELQTGLPLFAIDTLIDNITSQTRDAADNFGSKTPNYIVAEGTGRTLMVEKIPESDGLWVLKRNERIKKVYILFKKFNSGESDVLIINESASTGGSIHSSAEFPDRRPRIMMIMQVETDINTEVQKRGCIKRTGQVNLPAYLYIVSLVPCEIRTLLSLKRKLRKLDANTSANQVQSSDIVNILDRNGMPIEDIFNKYGEESFDRFRYGDENANFREAFMAMSWSAAAFAVTMSDDKEKQNVLEAFCREVELESCALQEEFYDKMNAIYRDVVDVHKEQGTYQLELTIDDLKSSIFNRQVIQLGSGSTEFSKPLFMEDRHTLERRKTLSKERVAEAVAGLCKDEAGKRIAPRVWYADFVEKFSIEYDSYIDGRIALIPVPDQTNTSLYPTTEEFDAARTKYDSTIAQLRADLTAQKTQLQTFVQFFRPDMPCRISNGIITDMEGNVKEVSRNGRFLGYKIHATSKYNKYSAGSLEFVFAALTGNPISRMKITSEEGKMNLTNTMNSTRTLFNVNSRGKIPLQGDFDRIARWEFNPNEREVIRVLTGNILSGIQYANDMKAKQEIKSWVMTKFTNVDGTLTTALKLFYTADFFVPINLSPPRKITVGLDNENIVKYILESPNAYTFFINQGVIKLTTDWDVLVSSPEGKVVQEITGRKVKMEIFQIRTKNSKTPSKNDNEFDNWELFDNDGLRNFGTYYISPVVVYDQRTRYELKRDIPKKDENKDSAAAERFASRQGFGKRFVFPCNTDREKQKLKDFLVFIHAVTEAKMEFGQDMDSFYVITQKPDTFMPEEQKKEVQLFEKSEYIYEFAVSKTGVPALRYLKADKTEAQPNTPENEVRYAVLQYPLSPQLALSYRMYPKSLTPEQSVKMFISLYDEIERTQVIKKIEDMIAAGEDDVAIGRFISSEAGRHAINDMRYLFGDLRNSQIGELMRTYLTKGDLAAIQFDVSDQLGQAEATIKKKTEITVEDAERILTYMMS